MTMDLNKCPIWGTPAEVYREPSMGNGGGGQKVKSVRAGGSYIYCDGAIPYPAIEIDPTTKAKLTTWILEENKRAPERWAEITSDVFTKIKAQKSMATLQRCDRLLEFLASAHPLMGTEIYSCMLDNEMRSLERPLCSLARSEHEYDDQMLDTAMAWTETFDIQQVFMIQKSLTHDFDYLEKPAEHTVFKISLKGLQRLEELKQSNADSKLAFVAMWFDESLSEVYSEAIEPAIIDAGYDPLRIDKSDHNNKICDQIIAEIKRARFVLADFTSKPNEPRGGVYYEAGYAQGLGIPVIWTCRKDLIETVHFDTRQFNHICWSKENLLQFREDIINRIRATIGQGPLKEWNEPTKNS